MRIWQPTSRSAPFLHRAHGASSPWVRCLLQVLGGRSHWDRYLHRAPGAGLPWDRYLRRAHGAGLPWDRYLHRAHGAGSPWDRCLRRARGGGLLWDRCRHRARGAGWHRGLSRFEAESAGRWFQLPSIGDRRKTLVSWRRSVIPDSLMWPDGFQALAVFVRFYIHSAAPETVRGAFHLRRVAVRIPRFATAAIERDLAPRERRR
jgi:hypothetical protein